jgi:hypothetical protein
VLRIKTAAFVVAAASSLGLAVCTPASADATDFVNGAVVDATDTASAALAAATTNVNSPDITCANPTAEGTVVTPATDAHPAGTVDGNDIGNGTGQCVTLQGTFFRATLITQIEYLPKGATKFAVIPGCVGVSIAPAASGIATPVVPDVPCNYPATAAWAFQPHRVHSILTNSLNANVYNGYSPVYNDLAVAFSVQGG